LAVKLAPPNEKGCVEFTGRRNANGYGVIRGPKRNGKTMLAHRFARELEHGPIPEGMQVLHSCDNPACCALDHLSLGTHADNMRQRDERGRTLKGAATARAKLSTEQVQEIRAALADGATHAEIAERFGISKTHVSYIRNDKTRRAA
jgi:hypothetical protein